MNAPLPAPPPPPGPRSRVPFRLLATMLRGGVDFFTDVHRTYGDVASWRIRNRHLFLVAHPDHIRDVLVTRDDNFTKGPALRMAKITLGEGLLTSEGDFHKRQRRIMQPAFHPNRVATYADMFVGHATRMADRWQGGQVIDVRDAMTQLTLEIVAKTLFGADLESEVRDIGRAMDVTVTMFDRSRNPFAPILNLLPLPSNYRFLRAKDRVFQTIDRMIADRRRQGGDVPKNDFLSILLAARDTDGDQQGMTDEQLRFEAMTLFSAGHETTANAMVWTWLLLSETPDAEAKLHAELDAVLDGRPPTHADAPRLTYARAVLAESMRLYPPAWVIAREAKARYPVGDTGYVIPPGGVILMPQWVVHRDPRWWPEPERFNPDRWLAPATDRPRYAYFPFGGGSRQCIGEAFAWLEGTLLLATLAQRFRLRRTDDKPVRLHPTITLRPRDPLPMKLEPR